MNMITIYFYLIIGAILGWYLVNSTNASASLLRKVLNVLSLPFIFLLIIGYGTYLFLEDGISSIKKEDRK